MTIPPFIYPIFFPFATLVALAPYEYSRIVQAMHDGQVRVMYRLPMHGQIFTMLCISHDSHVRVMFCLHLHRLCCHPLFLRFRVRS
ncbi:hypothetical protein V8F06_013132 [Rhypophila decipiens]